MGTQYYKDIQNAIDRYYEQPASGDIAIYGDTFIRRCISSIWGMAISPIRIEYTNDSVENLHEPSSEENSFLKRMQAVINDRTACSIETPPIVTSDDSEKSLYNELLTALVIDKSFRIYVVQCPRFILW